MSGGFNNPIIGGGGALVYPSIHSPDFSMIAETGWAIEKNGNAYFFNIVASGTITATEFIGTDFIANSSGIFFYNGIPAHGNLTLSFASTSGVDGFGNTYTGGVGVQSPSLFAVFGSNGQQIVMELNAGSPIMAWFTGVSEEVTPANSSAFINNAGATETMEWSIECAETSGFTDRTGVILSSSAKDGSLFAGGSLFYIDRTAVEHLPLEWGNTGVAITALGVGGNPKAGNTFAVVVGPSDFVGTVYLEDGSKPATPGTAAALYSTNGQLKFVDEQGNVNNPARTYFPVTGTPQTVNSTSLQNVNGINGITVAAQTYRVHGILKCTKGATADTNKFGFAGPGTGGVNVTVKAYLDNVATYTGILTSDLSGGFGSTTTASVNPAVNFTIEFDGEITFTAAGATFGLVVACGTNNADTWTVNSGFLDLMPCF